MDVRTLSKNEDFRHPVRARILGHDTFDGKREVNDGFLGECKAGALLPLSDEDSDRVLGLTVHDEIIIEPVPIRVDDRDVSGIRDFDCRLERLVVWKSEVDVDALRAGGYVRDSDINHIVVIEVACVEKTPVGQRDHWLAHA